MAVVAIMVASAFAIISFDASEKTLVPDDENEKNAKSQLGGTRKITYQIYDIGESYLKPTDYNKLGRHDHSKSGINSWYVPRGSYYNDTVIRDSYPYVVSYVPYSSYLPGPTVYNKTKWVTQSFYALKMDAENITSIATGTGAGPADPWILPIMAGGASPQLLPGGNVTMSMYFTYLTSTEYADVAAGTHYANSYYGVDTVAFQEWSKFYIDDGWLTETQGVFDFDTNAAKKFLGLVGSGNLITDFDAKGASAISDAWEAEWIEDGDAGRILDTYAKYDYSILSGNGPVFITVKLDPTSTSSKLVVRFWSLTWGAEALYTNYLWKTGITEELQPYMEDWYLNGSFTPVMGDIHSKMTAVQHLTAWKDPDYFIGGWMFEPQNMDYVYSDSGYISYFNNYSVGSYGSTYKPLRKCWVPGQEFYGADVGFWSTPMNWNLDQYESLSIQLPVNKPGWGIKPYKSTNFTLPGNSALEQRSNGYWGEWVLGHGRPAADIYSTATYNPSTKTLFWQGPKSFTPWLDEVYNSNNPTTINEAGTPFVMMDISRVSQYRLTIEGNASTIFSGQPYVLQVQPLNFTGSQAYSNQTVGLPPVAGVTYGATTHTFAWSETMWNTTVMFSVPKKTYYLISNDTYFFRDITDSYPFMVNGPIYSQVFTLQIYKGWNFITVPLVGYGYTASTLALEKLDFVVTWDPATQKYNKIFIVGVTPIGMDFPIEISTGYWVHAGGNRTLLLCGTIPTTTMTRAVTLPMGGGWVNIAFNTLNTTWKASMVPAMFTGGNVTLVSMYDPITDTYRTYITKIPQSDFTLVPGQAYWAWCTASGVFSYMPAERPSASFTYTVSGMTVTVDASESGPEAGIASYTWDWGDGTIPDVTTSPITSHTYGVPQGTVPSPPPSGGAVPAPQLIIGFTYDSEGDVVAGCTVTITNKRTGEYLTTQSDGDYGYYEVFINGLPWMTGDPIEVTAVSGEMFGSNWAIWSWSEPYLWIDVTLSVPGPETITLTVTYNDGWRDSISHTVNLPSPVPKSPPVAIFTLTTDRFTHIAVADASRALDEDGYITDYQWDWGDGAHSSGVTASHQYASGGTWWVTLVVTDNDGLIGFPMSKMVYFGPPAEYIVAVFGYTYDESGTILIGCLVNVTDIMTGATLTTVSDEYGSYETVFWTDVWVGDVIEVTAVKGSMSGVSSGIVEYDFLWYMWIDVYLTEGL